MYAPDVRLTLKTPSLSFPSSLACFSKAFLFHALSRNRKRSTKKEKQSSDNANNVRKATIQKYPLLYSSNAARGNVRLIFALYCNVVVQQR